MSNTAQNILTHYQVLQFELNLPALSDCKLQAKLVYRSAITKEGHATLWQEIEALQPVEGWLCFQSVVRKVENSQLPNPDQESGWLLNGELTNEAGESLHIWQDGGDWCITRFTEGIGDEHYLVQDAELLSVESDQKTDHYLNYRVYWRHHKSTGFQPYCSRFTGFSSRRRGR